MMFILPRVLRLIFVVSLLATLSACATGKNLLTAESVTPSPNSVVPVLAATLRAPDPDTGIIFSGQRSNALSFAEVAVSVPRERKIGTLELPGKKPDVAEEFTALRVDRFNIQSQFVQKINQRLEQLPAGERRVFIYVHGYNTGFAEAIFRHAQLMEDYKIQGIAVNFSWASADDPRYYLYDRDSAELARDGLIKMLKLVRQSNATQIVLLGHSVGGSIVMDTLRAATAAGDTGLVSALEATILAAPDIDVDVFNQQLDAIQPPPDPLIVIVSSTDRALQFGRRLRGGAARVGEGTNTDDLKARGITVIDLSNLAGTDRFRHNAFASSTLLQSLLTGGVIDPLLQTE